MNGYISPYDSNNSSKMGQDAFVRFKNMASVCGWEVRNSTREEDYKKHIDCFISKDGQTFSVDVKARKRVARGGAYTNNLWIELRGVNNTRGWLFGGHADFIAFESADGEFVVVERSEIIRFINSIKNKMSYVKSPYHALYNVYTRNGRDDKLTMIKPGDVRHRMKIDGKGIRS